MNKVDKKQHAWPAKSMRTSKWCIKISNRLELHDQRMEKKSSTSKKFIFGH